MKFAVWFSAVFGVLGIFAGVAILVLVVSRGVEATGAPPGGVLSGLGILGVAIAIIAHATFGMITGVEQGAIGILALLLLAFSLVGAVRRRRPWYTLLAGPALLVATMLLSFGAENVLDWLGSASDWDAAVSQSAVIGTSIATFGQLPLWGIWMWRWTNARPIVTTELEDRYAKTLAIVASGVGQFVGAIMGLLLLACEIGLLVVAWDRAGVWGVLLALFGGGIAYGIFTAVASLMSTMIAALASVSIGLPVASIVTVFSRATSPTPAPLSMQEA